MIYFFQSIRLQTRGLLHQSIVIYYSRYLLIDDGLETRAVFLDISEAFDKVWHEVLLYKLNGISDNLVNIIKDFLSLRKQRVVLNGQHWTWVNTEAGVSQGCILGVLFFLIYIHDLLNDSNSNPKLFVDDTSLYFVVQNTNSTITDLDSDLSKMSGSDFKWKTNFNPDPKKQAQEVSLAEKLTKLIIHRYFLIKI